MNPQVLDAMVRSGKFSSREQAQAWLNQQVAVAQQRAAAQQFGGMPGQFGGAMAPPPPTATFDQLMQQQKGRGKGKGKGS
jgi:hypothetical protein